MLKKLLLKIKESAYSVLPVALIVLIIYFTPLVSLTGKELTVFLVSTLFAILGIALFNIGADYSMTPMGKNIGVGLTKNKKGKILLVVAFLTGLVITVAEPDLTVLATQVGEVMNGTVLTVAVGVGVGLFLTIGVLKMVFKKQLSLILMFFYTLLFALSAILIESGRGGFLALSFDSGGVTTGPITVPFIMAFGVGIATIIGGKDAEENSFGLIALCSLGPILAVLVLCLCSKGGRININPSYALEDNVFRQVWITFLNTLKEVGIALALIVVIFAIIDVVYLKLPKKKIIKISIGVAYTFFGLVIFLTAVNVGFMPIGYKIGRYLAEAPYYVTVIFAFVLGCVVVLAEPAVLVLNKQIEDVTGGTVKKTSMMIALSVGVGISLALSVIRIKYGFSILYYLIPGYLLSLALSFFVPKLYTAIAFDSGGVASGPLSSGFILPMAIGICSVITPDNIISGGFGIVAMIAMTPLIAIQLLGFRAITVRKVKNKLAMNRILSAEDDKIINFM